MTDPKEPKEDPEEIELDDGDWVAPPDPPKPVIVPRATRAGEPPASKPLAARPLAPAAPAQPGARVPGLPSQRLPPRTPAQPAAAPDKPEPPTQRLPPSPAAASAPAKPSPVAAPPAPAKPTPPPAAQLAAPTPPPAAKPTAATAPEPRPAHPDWLSSILKLEPHPSESAPHPVQAAALAPAFYDSSSSEDASDADVTAPRAGERCDMGLCTFWIGPRCYALDVDMVGEVVSVEQTVEVPLTPPALLGLFNLRGTPVALVDLAAILELGATARVDEQAEGKAKLAMILRSSGLTVGAVIDRMESVVAPGREVLVRARQGDNPVVKGFIERSADPSRGVTVLAPEVVLDRLSRMKLSAGTRHVDSERGALMR